MGNCVVVAMVVVTGCAVADETPHRAPIATLLYLNGCAPAGCLVTPGADDARTQQSSMVTQPVSISAFAAGPDVWDELVGCVRTRYAPFGLTVTDIDPGPDTPHFEVVVGGLPTDLGLSPSIWGVAPSECPNNLHDNNVALVFGNRTTSINELCWAAAQESGHMFGLDHELDVDDSMSWLGTAGQKLGFQDYDARCGEYTPRACNCTGAWQNSYETLLASLGAAGALY